MARIQQLDTHVVNRIAAGEVIERPGSVIKELLENSVDALSTRIDIDIQGGGMELIRVADNGPGLPDRAKDRLFQPFAGSGRPDGAGLGLAIARELAIGHGGDLTLVESGPAGAVFELRLPGAVIVAPTRRRRTKAAAP